VSDPEGLGYRRAVESLQTHYAREGLIVSKCGCMDVKRLAMTWQQCTSTWCYCATPPLNLTSS